ncbi:hypothetical protein J0895_07260 [Phormidium pseudopriestleyi FRX01]|uniref:Late embryogenesis abundant protein n=1 Tax=Phormidium pseudopriestleyi FRX01 TaxID=1759528 RepID=A0ABS3FP58_9CYAN|nr:DUF6658 family protein [Phormidium pseudopriestleyi]MBO0348900.1 hypothetical protein [Phormidium pseudopriestleyi FRX01]
MKQMINWLKNISLRQILTGMMAGMLLFVGTACSNTPSVMAKTSDQVREEMPSKYVNSTYEGGMNEYPDTDPRQQATNRAEAQAKALKDSAERRIKDDSRTYPDKDLGGMLEEVPEQASKIGDRAENAANELGKHAKAGADLARETGETAFENTRDTLNKGAKTAAREAEKLGDRAQNTAENASDAVKSKVKTDLNRSGKALERTADSID